MSKPWTPNRHGVELRPSKIRRDPPPLPPVRKSVLPDDIENESWAVVIGIMAFALAITFLIFWVSDFTSPSRQPPPITLTDAG